MILLRRLAPRARALVLATTWLCACAGTPVSVKETTAKETPRLPAYSPSGGAQEAAQMRRQLFVASNVARRLAGRAPLTPDAALDLAAQRHAEDMLRKRYLAHRDRRGRGPSYRAEAAGYRGTALGENLARGPDSATRVVELWRRRRGHRKNLLGPSFTRTGIGYASNGHPERPQIYWVQLYGK